MIPNLSKIIEPGAILCMPWHGNMGDATFFMVEKRTTKTVTLVEMTKVLDCPDQYRQHGKCSPGVLRTERRFRVKVRIGEDGKEFLNGGRIWGVAAPWDGRPVDFYPD